MSKQMKNNEIVSITSEASVLNLRPSPTYMDSFDSFIINSISYHTGNVADLHYYLWSSYTQKYIASFTVTNLAMNSRANIVPNLEVLIKHPMTQLQFRLDVFDEDSGLIVPVPLGDFGFINIVLSFVKY